MITRKCAFETVRLRVDEWHRIDLGPVGDLAEIVSELCSPAAMVGLPFAAEYPLTIERAKSWIDERDAEGVTLLALDRTASDPVGLLILFEVDGPHEPEPVVDVRIGYLIAESAWGRGFASELVGGFVDWCRTRPSIRSLAGGVADDNTTSARVLTKHGFRRVAPWCAQERQYELVLHP